MQLTINGETQRFDTELSITELLEQLNMAEQRVAVEINGEILPRSRHAAHRLKDGDILEIVQAIGGG